MCVCVCVCVCLCVCVCVICLLHATKDDMYVQTERPCSVGTDVIMLMVKGVVYQSGQSPLSHV